MTLRDEIRDLVHTHAMESHMGHVSPSSERTANDIIALFREAMTSGSAIEAAGSEIGYETAHPYPEPSTTIARSAITAAFDAIMEEDA